MKCVFGVFLFFLWVPGSLFSQTAFEQRLAQFFDRTEYQHAQVGIQIIELETGTPVFELNPKKMFVPASVMKLVTSATALELLGPQYRFHTSLGYTGEIRNGVLYGDLVIRGGGDPALGSEYFSGHYFLPHFAETWIRQLKERGIRRIEGNLVLDGSCYDTEKVPDTWIWEDLGNYYGAGVSGLTVYDNLVRIHFRSPVRAGLPTEIRSVYPQVEGLTFRNEVVSSNDRHDLAWVFGSPLDGTRVIRGTIPKNRNLFTIKASNPYPEKVLAADLLHQLAGEGIYISGRVNYTKTDTALFNQIFFTESPPLREIISVMNHESVNLFAEHLVMQMATENKGFGNRQTGLHIIKDYWKEKGLDTGMLMMEDGSGLSPVSAVSPAFLTALLRHMATVSVHSESFVLSLPAAGEGTLSSFSRELFTRNSLRAKSGSMKRVRCYAGYFQNDAGQKLVFVFMVNHFEGSHQKLIAALQNMLVELRSPTGSSLSGK